MINRDKLIKGLLLICGIIILVSLLTHISKKNSITLEDYAKENPEIAYMEKSEESSTATSTATTDASNESPSQSADTLPVETTENLQKEVSSAAVTPTPAPPSPIGATLNADTVIDQRTTHAEGFYYEPLSENLRRYITGVSYPAVPLDSETGKPTQELAITYDDLCYLHILHYDFEGNPAEGELICNKALAQDLVEIFYELYCNEYQLEKVRLIDEYDGDDTASMEDNNTSCFNYRVVPNSTSLSKHALGCALDINPLYNPYITYEMDNTGKIIGENISPISGTAYADRSISFPYKIDENDLCYKLFTQHGFSWGGYFNNSKDYQHFYKVVQ